MSTWCCSELFPCASQELQSPLCPLTIIVNPTKDAAGRCAAYQWPVKTPMHCPGGVSLVHYLHFGTRDISLLSLIFWGGKQTEKSYASKNTFKVMRKHSYCLTRGLYFMLRWKVTCLWTRVRPKNGNKGRKTCRDMLNIYSTLPTASAPG